MEQRIKEILSKVAEIGQKVGQIQENKTVPPIEIDLIKEKIRQLYEMVHSLKGVSDDGMHPSPAEKQEILQKEPNTPTGHDPGPTAGTGEDKKDDAMPGKVQEISREKTGQEPRILADKYKGEQKYIHDTLTQDERKRDITSKLQSKPIQSIKSSLGINDRFKLIKELFNGDKDSFENTMGVLDDAGNFNEAFNYINTSFEWDMEDEAVQMLLDLVRRRFIMNQDD